MFLREKLEAFQAFQASQATQALTLKPPQPVEDEVECWDDDDDLQGIEDLQFRAVSTTAIASSFSNQPSHHRDSISSSHQASHHRDSISSRLSTRSDVDSNGGGDEDFQVLLPTDDELSTTTAIASAKSAGIPIPANVPSSALLGGTIKRLGGRRIKKVLGGDDWGEDLEMPKMEDGGLTLRKTDGKDFPDTLRQISGAFSQSPSPANSLAAMDFMERTQLAQPLKPASAALDKFRDEEGDEDFFGDIATIKVAKSRPTPKTINFIPPPAKAAADADNFEDGLELPSDGELLRLSTRKEVPKTPVSQLTDDFDTEWAEGSLGTRFGGTRRDGRSNRSSSFSALSPSVSSCLTAESEDEGLDGLILPDGPLKFDEALKKRLENVSLDVVDHPSEKQVEKPTAPKEDFFAGIDIGDGDVFDSGKLTLNRNIKHKVARQASPARRTAMTLTFTNKPQATTTSTRIPKPQGHERVRSKLESVSESGGPVPSYQRPRSSHSAKSSCSGIPAPSTPSSSNITTPSTPSRRGLMSKSSEQGQKAEPTTTGAQLLRSKRSMPLLRGQPSPARSQPLYPRPPSRADHSIRQPIPSRPKTPVDRAGAESSLANTRKPPVPFLPAGTSHAQSHHISIKTARHLRRPGSSDSSEQAPLNNRPISRLSNVVRPTTPTSSRASSRKDIAPESLAREAASKRHITKPTRRRAFGDGSELELFDDLPTSATTESRFVKQPIGRGAPKSTFRSRLGQTQNPSPSRTETPAPSPTKQESTPRFARDTNASRTAREQRTRAANAHPLREAASITHLAPLRELREGSATNIHPPREVGGPVAPLGSTNWKSAIAAKGPPSTPSLARTKTRKHANQPPQKPCLIKPLGDHVNSAKSVNGMQWNPTLFCWEGNENALAPFDAPLPAAQLSPKSSPGMKPAPALIANVGATKGVQVVGGMVFDPQRMCWLKMGPGHGSDPRSPDSVEEEEDPFAGLEDLDEGKSVGGHTEDSKGKSGFGGDDEWLVGEEFDVGPEFVRRQRAEEEKWRKKVDGWVGVGRDTGDEWKWAIRALVVR